MIIDEFKWQMWMRWKSDNISHKQYYLIGVTSYSSPLERTKNNKVVLLKSEEKSYKQFQKYFNAMKMRMYRLKIKYEKQYKAIGDIK